MSKKDNKMNNMTLEQFLLTYNFRNSDGSYGTDGEWNTQTIRISLDYKDVFATGASTDWIEFGHYDFGSKETALDRLREVFNKDLLKLYVSSFRVLDTGYLLVYLTKESEYDFD